MDDPVIKSLGKGGFQTETVANGYGFYSDCAGSPCEKIRNGNLIHIHHSIDTQSSQFSSYGIFAPNSSAISCWVKSHGAAWMSRFPNQSGYSGLRKDIVMDAQVGGRSNGVLQFQSFEKDKLYFLKFKYQVVNPINNQISGMHPPPYNDFGSLDHFYVKLVNANHGSEGFNTAPVPYNPPVEFVVPTPSPSSFQTIADLTNIPETVVPLPNPSGSLPPMQEASFCVKANADYNAIWFYPQQEQNTTHNSRIRIKDIKMYEASAGADITAGCGGGSAVVLGQGCPAIPGASYSWTPATGLSNSNVLNPTLTTVGLANLQNGVQYTLTVNWNGCSVSDTITITSNTPILNMPQQIPICKDDLPITLNANPADPDDIINYTWYEWNTFTSQFEVVAGPLAAPEGQTLQVGEPGYFAVLADAGNNCIAVAYTAVFIQQLPANLNTDFALWAVGPAGQPTFQMYVNPAINPSAQGLFHAYYISEVNANFQSPQFVGVAWGNNGLQLLSYINVNTQIQTTLFNRETYYEIKHGIWNECGDWTETRRYIYVD